MKIDLHVHSSELSLCGKLSAADTIDQYKAAGFDGIVLTNHFSRECADHFTRHGVEDYFAFYHKAYEEARAYGESKDFLVLCGYELRFDGSGNDYLVFGMTREQAANGMEFFSWGPERFGRYARENGILFYQAHPFRNDMKIVNPSYIFGMEIINCNNWHDSRNDIAKAWAEKFSLHQIAGSDCHESHDIARAGIEIDGKIRTMDELVALLREDRYRIYAR